MLTIIQKYGLHAKAARDAFVVLAVVFGFSFLSSASQAAVDLPAQLNKENRVSIKVKPVEFEFGKPANFAVSLNAHSGSLDFDLTKISVLEDDKGGIYRPTGWDGSPPGGHHRSGTLSFPQIATGTKVIKLTVRDIYDVPERIFEWVLQ